MGNKRKMTLTELWGDGTEIFEFSTTPQDREMWINRVYMICVAAMVGNFQEKIAKVSGLPLHKVIKIIDADPTLKKFLVDIGNREPIEEEVKKEIKVKLTVWQKHLTNAHLTRVRVSQWYKNLPEEEKKKAIVRIKELYV